MTIDTTSPDSADPIRDPGLLAAFASGLGAAALSCATMSEGRLTVTAAEVSRLTAADVLVSAGGPEIAVAAVYIGFVAAAPRHMN